ncbi:MDR family MFS transporter [Rhodoplanes sp. Z2-YC6860]|uniref:MDR family MFS transporter n=1 Tax=Rhodoplanes sp. Z2-YC6860 TaxID=674703 RepID=UPI001F16954E|nr:MDR family MFS transporter [Rhodoplanes sp. Z2-YC6860]
MTMPNPPAKPAATPAPAPLDHGTIVQIMTGILLAMFLSALEQTIVAPALPTIGRSLGNVESLSWVVSAYLLTYTAATPLFGKLSDIYGRRLMLLLALAIFIVGSAACALAPNMPALIVARALQGIGGGGILPIAHTVIGDMVAPRERARYQSYTAVMFMMASVLGPLLGGVLTDHFHWTLIFWINLPMGALALWMTDRALRKLPRHDRPHTLDVLGALLMMLAALPLMLAMSWGGTHYPWSSAPILGLLFASVAFWVLFGLRVARAPEPFIPLSILREPTVCATSIAGFFSVGVFLGLTVFLPVYFELVLGFSPSGSGIVLIVWLAAITAGSFVASRLITMTPRYKRVPLGGLVIGIVMLALLAAFPARLSLLEASVLLGVGGAGMGVMYPITTTIVQNTVAPHQLGIATGALNFMRQLGGTITVAAFGAIVLGGVDIGGKGLTLDMLRGGTLAGADFAVVFGWLFAAGTVLLVAAFIAVLMIEEKPLRSGRDDGGRPDLGPDADRIAAE